jgi:hypothetical protein
MYTICLFDLLSGAEVSSHVSNKIVLCGLKETCAAVSFDTTASNTGLVKGKLLKKIDDKS